MVEINENLPPSRKLYERTKEDYNNLQPWRTKQQDINELRLQARKTRRLPYRSAPNFLEPIIDDTITRVTAIQNRIVWMPKNVATFIPYSQEAARFKEHAELAFHHLVSMTLNVHRKISLLLDTHNQYGVSFAFTTVNTTAYRNVYRTDAVLPDFVYEHPDNVVLPPHTQSPQTAERFTRILKYSPEFFAIEAQNRNWRNWREVLNVAKTRQTSQESNEEPEGYSPMIGLERMALTDDEILVFESYYHDKQGRKRKVDYSPLLPDKPLSDHAWQWSDGSPRRWPLFAIVREDRTPAIYDSRGYGELVRDNQLAATQFKNMRATLMDYFALPMFKGANPFSANNLKIGPGESLPEGVEPIYPQDPSTFFGFSIDEERVAAARRSGSEFGAMSHSQSSKDPVTATEVNRQAMNSDMLSLDAIARFTEPLSLAYSMMWEWLQHNPVRLPVIDQSGNDFVDELSSEVFQLPFLVKSAANARNSDPIFLLNQLLGLLPILTQSQVIKQDQLMRFVVNQLDPVLADRIVVSTSDGAPVEQAVIQLAEQIAGLSQIVEENRQYITADIEEEQARDEEEKINAKTNGQATSS